MERPRFITFTGVDQFTDLDEMDKLSTRYPIEWGILFSPQRQGTGRYPPLAFVQDLVASNRSLDYSAHLCGGYARQVIETMSCSLDPLITDFFTRAQINTTDPSVSPANIARWSRKVAVKPILQCRGSFPEDLNVVWLYDTSGGRGTEADSWPAVPSKYRSLMVGYAGGLRPTNVAHHLELINLVASDYWIDMESGVRDDNDRFDLGKCRAVCEAVYGKA